MNSMRFAIVTVVNFVLKIIALKPATLGAKWKFVKDEFHGITYGDGITAFQEVIVAASKLPKEEGYSLLFADGLNKDQTTITGDDRLIALANRKLADPDLLWSLFNEEGQKTLTYLHDTYGVVWMEAVRRVLYNPETGRCSLFLFRRDDGSWLWDCERLEYGRDASRPVLVLGE